MYAGIIRAYITGSFLLDKFQRLISLHILHLQIVLALHRLFPIKLNPERPTIRVFSVEHRVYIYLYFWILR